MKRFLNVNDVCELLDRKPTYGYKVIRELNEELKKDGFYVNPGRVPAKYFCERMGIEPDEETASI